jgi:hypothetical protein
MVLVELVDFAKWRCREVAGLHKIHYLMSMDGRMTVFAKT